MTKAKKILFSIIYWFLNLTWGALLTIPGLLVTGFLILIGKPAYKNGCSYYVVVGGNWGGSDIGPVSVIGDYRKSSYLSHIRKHEFGHGIQNAILGPFMLFLVFIPSTCRYWYDRLEKKHASERGADWYDSIWFEGTATRWGTIHVDLLEGDQVNTLRPLFKKNWTVEEAGAALKKTSQDLEQVAQKIDSSKHKENTQQEPEQSTVELNK